MFILLIIKLVYCCRRPSGRNFQFLLILLLKCYCVNKGSIINSTELLQQGNNISHYSHDSISNYITIVTIVTTVTIVTIVMRVLIIVV